MSDRLSSTMGRRRPVMLLASLFSAAGGVEGVVLQWIHIKHGEFLGSHIP